MLLAKENLVEGERQQCCRPPSVLPLAVNTPKWLALLEYAYTGLMHS